MPVLEEEVVVAPVAPEAVVSPVLPGRELTVADVLYKAADIVDKGWTQFEEIARTKEGDVHCAIGAIRVAVNPKHYKREEQFLYMQARKTANRVAYDLNQDNIMGYNDTEGRTKEEVALALRMAGDLAVKEGIGCPVIL